jgi:RNA polymerase-binding transcription factor DksA
MPIEKQAVPLNFLLGCSQTSLQDYRLARMAEAAAVRKDIQALFDKLREVDLLVQLTLFFEQSDREALKNALENEEDAATWARRMIRGGGDILPRLKMDPAGLCRSCGEPVCRESVQYCAKHLEKANARQRMKKLVKAHRLIE